jgi:hypothetical protein
MQMREALKKTASIHIGALLAIDLTGLEGASPPERREVAILMRNDAEMLDKKRNEMEEERRLLQEELKLKKTLSRLQGFPRGIENKPIKDQTKALEDRLLILDQAIDRYAERIQTLFAVSDQMLAGSPTEKDPLR